MDSLTHIVIGACLGELIAGKQLGKKAMLIGALSNSLPDIDVVCGLWNSSTEQLLAHRGITHSILFAFICSPLLAYYFKRRDKQNLASFRRWLVLIGSGLLLHIFIDAFTAYGTGWFEPFNHSRVSFNTLYILDPIFSLPMLIGAVILVILNKQKYPHRKRVAQFSIAFSLLYLSCTIFIKLRVNKIIEEDITAKNMSYESYMVTPTPMNNLLWYSILRQKKDYYIAYYSILDKDKKVFWELYAKNDSLLGSLKKTKEVAELIQFSNNYYCMSLQNGDTTFNDMRFGQIGGWVYPQAEFVFKFNLKQQGQSQVNLQQGRFKSFNSKDLKILLKRMGGERP